MRSILAFGVEVDFTDTIKAGKFGPFKTTDQAEKCLVALSGRMDVKSAEITLIKKEDGHGRLA